jgi:penicillin V acylase-like amidase (Ntn superfamily)
VSNKEIQNTGFLNLNSDIMKRLLSLLLISHVSFNVVTACTTFLIHKNGQLAFGRNYDWITDVGLVCNNLRGLSKTSHSGEAHAINWVSRYGSVTFNQYGKEFPMGGMNEKGLVVEIMWLDGSKYPEPDTRPGLGVLQWVQYQLDNCSTVDEVIATDTKIRITRENPPIHYLVADINGNAATVEFLDGKMVVHKGKDLPVPVLTNTDYATSSKMLKASMQDSSSTPAFNDNSLQRFATACSMVQQYHANGSKQPIIDFSFEILGKVSNDDFTKWSIVYDISNKKIYFKSKSSPQIKWVSYADLDFSCQSAPLALDMSQPLIGNVIKEFKPFTKEANTLLLNRAAKESKSQINISEADIRRDVEYVAKIKCK